MPKTIVQPYLFFGGRCEEAIDFYRAALGAAVDILLRFKDSPEPPPEGTLPPGFGTLTDRFGVSWMINVEGEPPH